jgi:pyruvate/2-oxoglutarate dehydrogenase complex dihydrolipoamide dehydrogenase (E3) component
MVRAGRFDISARRFVIATGSSPAIPPIDGLEETPYLTNESLFELRERPSRLLIVGAGPIGVEMGQAFCRLGSRVTILEAGEPLAREDREAAAILVARMESE